MNFRDKDEMIRLEKEYAERNGGKRLINSLSGGVDSSASGFISKVARPHDTIGLILPCSSKAELQGERQKDIIDGHRVADHLGIPAITINISPLWEMARTMLTSAAQEMSEKSGMPIDQGRLNFAMNNLKPTLRMMVAGCFADIFNGLMMGTDNAIENFLGYFSIRGDGIADRQPLRHLTKEEVYQLLEAANFPADLARRVPTAGLWPGQTDEGELGFSYANADAFVTWALESEATFARDGKPVYLLLDETMTMHAAWREIVDAHGSNLPPCPVSDDVADRIVMQNRKTFYKRKPHDLEATMSARGLL